jgi:hypothetical protein
MGLDLDDITDEEKAIRRRWKFAEGRRGMWAFVEPVMYLSSPNDGEPLPMFSIDATLVSVSRAIGYFLLPMGNGGTMDLYVPLESVGSFSPAPPPVITAPGPKSAGKADVAGKVLAFPRRPPSPDAPSPPPSAPPETPPSDP